MQPSQAPGSNKQQGSANEMRAKAKRPRPGRSREKREAVRWLEFLGVTRAKEIAAALIDRRDWQLGNASRAVSEDQLRRRVIELVGYSIDLTLSADKCQALDACHRDLRKLEQKAQERQASNTWHLRLDGSLTPNSDRHILDEQREIFRRHADALGRSRAARQERERRPDLVAKARTCLKQEKRERLKRGERLERELGRGGIDTVTKRLGKFRSRERRLGRL
jgi:hypothetical protein